MNWNIEWMNPFFASDTEFVKAAPSHGIKDCAPLMRGVAAVIKDLNPDVGPNVRPIWVNFPFPDFGDRGRPQNRSSNAIVCEKIPR